VVLNMKTYNKIILISLDTLRSDCIPYNPVKLYPNEYQIDTNLNDSALNRLVQESCFFNNTVSVAPYTSASHAAYFTGSWPKNNGLYDQFNSRLRVSNLFEMAGANGYKTVFKTDFPFVLGKYLNLISGVDRYFVETESEPLDLVRNTDKVLAFFHFGQIHYPYGFHSLKFAPVDYPNKLKELEDRYSIKTENINLEDMAVETFRNKEDLECLYRYKKIISYLYRNKLDNDLFNLYLEGINYFHQHKFNSFLEQLLKIVKNENYLLVIFSDHGEAWNEDTYGHHNSIDEGVIRVPMIFNANDIDKQLYTNRVRTIDLFPTLQGFISGKDIYKNDGSSLSDIIFNKKEEKDRDAFSAVWVNEAKDVLENVKSIESKDSMTFRRRISVKYSAAYYKDNHKYIENYRRFVNRSEHIEESFGNKLYQIKQLTNFNLTQDVQLKEQLSKMIFQLNDIKEEDANIPDETLRKYFRLQGYNI